MRVISGKLGGRQFDSPHGSRTHPMSEKIRGALFNMLGDIAGMTVLDGFAGSGALGFESISRGARQVVAIDIDKSAHSVIVSNAGKLGVVAQIKAIRANAGSWSDNNPDALFDIVLCDPPYDAVQNDLLVKIAAHTKVGGIVVLSLPPSHASPLPTAKYRLLSTKQYGDSQLLVYSS
jgi:16S rRNA (guanine966-N2)-methyltransferase